MRDRFRQAGLGTPELDARLLAERAFGLGGLELAGRDREPAPANAVVKLHALADSRLAGEPIARILGAQEFYGLRFALSPATLVPRPETEMLVDFGLEHLPRDRPSSILDLGTGSGCIAIALLANLPHAQAIGVDLSAEAIACARGNAVTNGLAGRFEGRLGSWFAPLKPGETFDLVVSNPPYIETGAIAGLAPEVREHDPLLALDGGPDGLAAYRIIAADAAAWLSPGGWIALEVGAGQGDAVAALLIASGFAKVAVKNDLAGLDRMVFAHHV